MNRLILAAALAVGCTLASSTPALAAPRNYDCSKPGNANKAVCKTGAKGALKGTTKLAPAAKTVAPAKPAKEAKAAPAAKPAAKVATTTTKSVTRNYDCSKPGNANKAQCKGSTTVATSTTKTIPSPAKPGMLQRMKNAMSGSSTPAPKPAAAPKVTPAVPVRPATTAKATENSNPAGAIAQCKDGTYSHAKTHTGACSRHGGVGKWLG
jgi:hypothetical protein